MAEIARWYKQKHCIQQNCTLVAKLLCKKSKQRQLIQTIFHIRLLNSNIFKQQIEVLGCMPICSLQNRIQQLSACPSCVKLQPGDRYCSSAVVLQWRQATRCKEQSSTYTVPMLQFLLWHLNNNFLAVQKKKKKKRAVNGYCSLQNLEIQEK